MIKELEPKLLDLVVANNGNHVIQVRLSEMHRRVELTSSAWLRLTRQSRCRKPLQANLSDSPRTHMPAVSSRRCLSRCPRR